MVDVAKALRAFLLADTAVMALVTNRIFVGPLPKDEADSMPRQAIVIRMSGGPEDRGHVRLTLQRFDIFSYGASEIEAGALDRAVYEALKLMEREVVTSTLLHSASPTGAIGPIQDPDGNWPLVVRTWLILAAETTAA